jgi:hypothetical protein
LVFSRVLRSLFDDEWDFLHGIGITLVSLA